MSDCICIEFLLPIKMRRQTKRSGLLQSSLRMMAIVSVSILTILVRKLPVARSFQGEEAYITLERCNSLPSISIIQFIPLQYSLAPPPPPSVCFLKKKQILVLYCKVKQAIPKRICKQKQLNLNFSQAFPRVMPLKCIIDHLVYYIFYAAYLDFMATHTEDYSSSQQGPAPLQIGMWDQEEHCRFLRGIVCYGKDWKQVRELIGTRREKQIQSHYQKYARRVAKMVKKIKRKGPNFQCQDVDLESEKRIYRQLFTKKDLTKLTPSQIRSMILCVCPSEMGANSPRKERNIILRDPIKSQREGQTMDFSGLPTFFGSLGASPLRADLTNQHMVLSQSLNHSPKSFFIAVSERKEEIDSLSQAEATGKSSKQTCLDAMTLAGFFIGNGSLY